MKHLKFLSPIPMLAAFAFVYGSGFGNSGYQLITEAMHRNSCFFEDIELQNVKMGGILLQSPVYLNLEKDKRYPWQAKTFPEGLLLDESEIWHSIYSSGKTGIHDPRFPLIDAIKLADSVLAFASNEMKEWLVFNGCVLKYIPVSEYDDDYYGSVVKTAFYKDLNFKQDENDIVELLLLVQLVKDYDAQGKTKVTIAKIMKQIVTGDITGALRSYEVLMDKDMRQFTRLIVKKLDSVRKARSTVISNFAKSKPPRTYAGKDPSQAARAQDKSKKYIQVSKKFLQELNEPELVKIKQTIINDHGKLWAIYINMGILDTTMSSKNIVRKIKELDLGQFGSEIRSMMNNNILFLSIQTKVQNVSQQLQLMSNIYKADSDAKLNAVRNVRDGDEEDKLDSLTLMKLIEYNKTLFKSPTNLGCGLDSLVYFSSQVNESANRVTKLVSELSGFYSFIKLSNRLLNERQITDSELIDALNTQRRDIQTFWEAYSGMRDADFNTSRTIMGFR